jgi:hypothetical protein
MREVSDGFLLNMAEVSAGLIGLFLVGVFFYLERGFTRFGREGQVIKAYFRAGARIVLVLFAVPLGLSLTLVILEPVWNSVLFALLSVVLVAANIDTAARIRSVARVTRSTALIVNEILGTIGVAVLIVLPWILGGLHPSREDMTLAILLAFASGFLSIASIVMSAFEVADLDVTGPEARPTDG